jgi:hypothetical protein
LRPIEFAIDAASLLSVTSLQKLSRQL